MKKNIKLRVRNLIKKHNTSNPYILCEKLNIEIRYFDFEDIKGYYKKVLRRKYIVLNENLDEFSQKVVLCHELGHAILHSSNEINLMKTGFFNYTSILENEANEFAAILISYQNEEIYDISACKLELKILEEIRKYIK